MSSTSEDVKTLFRRFGGEADTYQELVREGAAIKALGKWAMLGQVDITHPQLVPGVKRVVNTAITRPMTEGMYAEPAPRAVTPARHAPAVTELPSPPAVEPQRHAAVAPKISVLSPEPKAEVAPLLPETLMVQTETPPSPAKKPRRSPPVRASLAPSPTTPVIPVAPVTGTPDNSLALSPLAARLKAPPVSPPTIAEEMPTENHTLSGLFGRLSKSLAPSSKQGVLRRKFSK